MRTGEPRLFSFANDLVVRDADWAAIVEKYRLRAAKSIVEFVGYNSLVYTDLMFSSRTRVPIPALNSTIKIRQAGFPDCIDTEDMFREQFRRLQENHAIPPG